MTTKTVHVIPEGRQWAVRREGKGSDGTFRTKQEAVTRARDIVRTVGSGQLVVYGRNGQIRHIDAVKMPPVLTPPGKKSSKIDQAVSKVTLDRLYANDPTRPDRC